MTLELDIGRGDVPPTSAPGEPGAPALPPGHVQVYCADPPTNLVCLLGEDPVVVSGGFGGWEVVSRPKQVGMTLWNGGDPYTVQLPLMLDGFARGKSVERSLRRLMRLARGDDDSEPGVLQVGGVPLPADDWVVEGVDFGEPIRRSEDLALTRQPITLTLREFVPPEFVQFRRRALAPAKRKTRIVRAKNVNRFPEDEPQFNGERVSHLARRLGVKWTTLRDLNPKLIKRANQLLRPGTKVRAPVRAHKPKKKGRKH